MSWFFGKKKQHRESPPESTGDPAQSEEGFVFLGTKNQPDSDSNNQNPGLYPSLDNTTPYPAMPSQFVKQGSQENDGYDLRRIPFKFSEELARNLKDNLEIDKLRLDEISSFIERINTEDYDYPFSLERSVINEMNSRNEE